MGSEMCIRDSSYPVPSSCQAEFPAADAAAAATDAAGSGSGVDHSEGVRAAAQYDVANSEAAEGNVHNLLPGALETRRANVDGAGSPAESSPFRGGGAFTETLPPGRAGDSGRGGGGVDAAEVNVS